MARGSAFNLRIFDTTGATSGAVTVCERLQSDARGMTQSPLPTSQEPPPNCRHAGFYALATGCLQKRETRNHQGGTPGRAFLTDLGMAWPMVVAESAGSVANSLALMAGTLHDLSPEQFRDEAPGPPSDRYARGVSTYELLTSQYSFGGSNPIALGLNMVADDPASVRSLRREVPDRVAIAMG